jgi:hypothetical protein
VKIPISIIIAGAMVAVAIYYGMTKMTPIPPFEDCLVALEASESRVLSSKGLSSSPSPNCHYHWLTE